MQSTTHHHYFDYGYKEWQCIECDSSTDDCESENDAMKVDNIFGCIGANRWPMGLPGTDPAFIKWAEEQGL